jgi:DNA repair exonuclease SbcCD ATPase subunit
VASDSEHSVRDAIVRLESEVDSARAEAERLKRLLDNASTEQTCIERDRRARAQLTPQIKEMRAKIDALIPPTEPESPTEALATIEQLGMDAVMLSMAREDVAETERALTEAKTLTQSDIATFTRYQTVASATGCCPLCGVTGQWKGSELGAKIAELRQKATVIAQQIGANWDERDRIMAQQAQADETLRQATLLVALYEEERSTYAARCATFEQGFEAMIGSVQTMESQLASLPAERSDLDREALTVKHAEAQAALTQLSVEVSAERQKLGVAAHRQGQMTAQTAAERRADQLKALLASLKRVRDRMLDDAVAPLRTALESLEPICLKGWQWTLVRDGAALDMVMRLGNHRELPVESLSVGERYLATLALLVAKAMVQRERWSGLFLDNFEVVFPEQARVVILDGLTQIVRTIPGPVDNAFVAGACDAPPSCLTQGVLSYTRASR